MSEVYQITHLVPVSLSRFKSTGIDNGEDVSSESENPSNDLAGLSVRILLDGLSDDMVMVKNSLMRNEHGRRLGGVVSSRGNNAFERATLEKQVAT